jgi:hypothetical protein
VEAYAGFEPQIGEIRALRTFRIGPGGLLYPLFSDQPWVDGTNTAHCYVADYRAVTDPHDPPASDCTCGYYAYASEGAAAENAHAQHVLAVIATWGKVVAGTRGIRAEHARIEALWMSGDVPVELTAAVATGYPSTLIYVDRSAMLAEHPPTALDCYEPEPVPAASRRRVGLRVSILAALTIGSAFEVWIWRHQDVRLVWAAELCLFAGLVALLWITRGRARSPSTLLLYAGMTVWLVAPAAGVAGVLLLRLPILEIAALGLIHRAHVNREARRFPARIG